MQAKFASLSSILCALLVAQLVGAVPRKVDCSRVRCAAVHCRRGQTAQTERGSCCPTCVPCSRVFCPLIACDSPVTRPGQCCPTCKPKRPDCKAVLCPDCVGVIEPGNGCPTCGLRD
ncbi:hypothetical protein C8J57DRAFT_1260232 [Mycena rebaudengoi]|nr:hypothetical protein C8J57DRAFT_1260232 [Mycena rebaudengoi]